ncbi:MAG: hypothetical protein LBR61_01585 [Synergistaceae bacterium]|jgi:hypothetical protein|nr:hypothetical protein [Synergistaceae bacterium]
MMKLIIPGFYVPPKDPKDFDNLSDAERAAIHADYEALKDEVRQQQIKEQEYINKWFYDMI